MKSNGWYQSLMVTIYLLLYMFQFILMKHDIPEKEHAIASTAVVSFTLLASTILTFLHGRIFGLSLLLLLICQYDLIVNQNLNAGWLGAVYVMFFFILCGSLKKYGIKVVDDNRLLSFIMALFLWVVFICFSVPILGVKGLIFVVPNVLLIIACKKELSNKSKGEKIDIKT